MKCVGWGTIIGVAIVAACAGKDQGVADVGVDAGPPDAGNQVSLTCFATTWGTVPTSDACTFITTTGEECFALETFTIASVYRCSDVDGEARMPSGIVGCTKAKTLVEGTTDWWCQPISCTLDPYNECMGDQYDCPEWEDAQLALFSAVLPSSCRAGNAEICCY